MSLTLARASRNGGLSFALRSCHKDALIAAVRAGELDDLFSHAAKAGAIGKPKCLTGTTGRRRIVARSFFT